MAVNIGSLTLVSGLFLCKLNSKNLQSVDLWYDFHMEKLRIYLLLLVVFFINPSYAQEQSYTSTVLAPGYNQLTLDAPVP